MNIEKDFSDFINDWGGLKTGTLILGGSNLFSSWILPSLMADFAALYPQIQIRLVEESTVKLTEMLQSGSIDLVLDNTSLNPEIFDSILYQEEHLILAVPGSLSVNDSLRDFQPSPVIDKVRKIFFYIHNTFYTADLLFTAFSKPKRFRASVKHRIADPGLHTPDIGAERRLGNKKICGSL